MKQQTQQLGSAPIFSLLLRLALPSIAGLLVGNLYVMVDRIFVGHWVGPTGLAAMTAVTPVTMIVWGIAILIGRGGQVLYSIALGQKRYGAVQRLFGQNLALSLTAGAGLTIFGLVFLDEILFFFGVTQSALEAGRSYLSISLYGTVFIMLGFSNNFIRAEGYSSLAMFTQVIGALTNVGLDYLFVAKLSMGMAGAAYATVIAQGCSAAWVLAFFLSRKTIAKIRLRYIRFYSFRRVLATLYNGLSPFSIGISGSIVWTVQNRMLIAHGGDLALAAFGVILTVAQFLFTPIFGVCMGMQPIIGYNTGAEKYDRVLKTFRVTCLLGAALGLPLWATVMIFPEKVMQLFVGNRPELISIGAFSMRDYLMLMPAGAGVAIFVSQYFQSVGKPLYALLIAMSRQLLFELPLALILPGFFGYAGVVFSAPIGDCIAAALAISLIRREIKRLKKLLCGSAN
ncbi:MAG: MATE family efflux transporter [Victivallaceae bacterium]|nr:MATE family efflux transporter [Victivallaceae bacterium]